MNSLIHLLEQHGPLLVFLNVLLEQAGLPIPAYPTLVVAGALANRGQFTWLTVSALAIAACFVMDLFWYEAGKRYGKAILRLLCKASLSPDSCESQTQDRFIHWGPKSLLISKFVPGFNTIASPLAGAMRVRKLAYLACSLGGTVLWAGSAILLGHLFGNSIDRVLDVLATMSSVAISTLLTLLALFAVIRAIQRHRIIRQLHMARISVDELADLIDRRENIVIVDARTLPFCQVQAPMENAIFLADKEQAVALEVIPRDWPVVLYCNCPNEATAVGLARQLFAKGFNQVRLLVGGLDAWHARQPVPEFVTEGVGIC